MRKFVLNGAKEQHIYTRLSYVRVASYTSHTLLCLNSKQVTVKLISKEQQPVDLFPQKLPKGFRTK